MAMSQFWGITTPKSDLENICDNVKDNVDLIGLKNVDFGKLSREDQNMLEESVYAMMEKFKNMPLELDNTMPKELYTIVENKWHHCLNVEKQIRETTLAQLMPKLTKGKIKKENKKHGRKFAPKYKAFIILQNNIVDFVNKSTKMWKLIYSLTTSKEGEEDPFQGKNDGEEEDNNKEHEIEKEKVDTIEEEAQKQDEMTTIDEQQTEQTV